MQNYEVKKYLGRFIVYRVVDGKHLRQGSYPTEREAYEQINRSINIMNEAMS